MKNFYIYVAMLGVSFGLNAGTAHAQGKFDWRVGNPFIFCKAPKPCRTCQPWRNIHDDICAGQSDTSKEEDRDPSPPAPVVTPAPPTNNPQDENTAGRTK